MNLYIVRHGNPNYDNDCLTPLGHEQAEAADMALDAIDARGIRDDASLFDLFNVIDAAVNSRHRVAPEMQTLERAIIKSAARGELGQERKPGLLKVISRRQIHAYWRFLQARDRYVHTGAISPESRAWLVEYARQYDVAINQEG